jgi:aerobic carbon-monoxide dehydrogenase medium subunit
MFSAPFEYERPTSLEEALQVLAERGDEAKVMAGGQSLIPLLKLRLAAPGLVVDIGRVPGLAAIAHQEGGGLTIGARARHVDVERGGGRFAILPEAARQISDPLIRNAGTVGGSLCHADPSGDWGAVMLALDAVLVARSTRGERTIPAAGFFDGPFTTVLEPDEILTEIRVPAAAGRSGGAYLKLERKIGDFATVAVAVQVELANGHVGRAGIGLTSVGATNLRAARAEELLAGAAPDDAVIDGAARLAAAECEPHTDVRGSADYKRDVVRVFVKRGLRAAIARARGEAA